jgi:hypothetical protein
LLKMNISFLLIGAAVVVACILLFVGRSDRD